METVLTIALFIAGLVALIKGGDWFVDGSCGLARKFRVPELLIGATVVSIGTTLPEVMVSATGAFKGSGAMAYGNAIGSVICNTALIAAITVAVKPSSVDKKTLKIPVLFFFASALFYVFCAYYFGEFSRISGIILLTVFAVYIILSVYLAKNKPELAPEAEEAEDEGEEEDLGKLLLLLVLGAALIAVGAWLLVENGQKIAIWLGVPETVVALTFVALGTSLPELVTAVTALSKGHGALSLGNVIGANLFNLVLVSGTAVTISPFKVPAEKMFMGYNTSLLIELPLMLFVMVFLCVPALIRGKLSRWQGVILLMVYFGFCAFQFFA